MANILASLLVYVFILILCLYVVMTWIRWARHKTNPNEPKWKKFRDVITAFGFALTSISLGLINALAVHAFVTGGLPYYHPILLLAFRLGFFSALFGMLAAFIGTGQLENPTIAVSGLCLPIWILEAIAQ